VSGALSGSAVYGVSEVTAAAGVAAAEVLEAVAPVSDAATLTQ